MSVFVVAYPLFGHSDAEEIARFRQNHTPENVDFIAAHITTVFAVTSFSYEEVLDRTRQIVEERGGSVYLNS